MARNEGPDHDDFADLVAVGNRVSGADRAVGAEDEEPLEIGMGLHLIDCSLVTVIDAVRHTEAIADLLHLRILRLLERDGIVSPKVMKGDGQTADVHDILALAADRVGKSLEMGFAERLVLDELDVPVGVLLTGQLVHNYLDAGVLGALQHRLERLAVIGNHADDVDLFGDQVFDRANLLCGIVGGRVDDRGVDPEVGLCLQDALFNIVEPRNLDFPDHAEFEAGCS